jgi:hypothetical protein
MSDVAHLTGEQVRAVIEARAHLKGVNFTEAVEQLTAELGIGRRTLFDWVEKGLPSRQNLIARRTLVLMSQGDLEQQ